MQKHLIRYRAFAAPLTMAVILSVVAGPAAAAGFTDFLNNILKEFNAAKQPIALIAIMLVGVGWLFNFVDLRRAAWVVCGIVLVYAATEVLKMVTG